MEYIKNVVLKFMLTESHSVKQQLTSAIGSVLLFSPSEVDLLSPAQLITFVDKQRSASTITHASNTQTVAKDAVTVLCMFYLFSFLFVCFLVGKEGEGTGCSEGN